MNAALMIDSQHYYQTMVEASPDGMAFVNKDGFIIICNNQLAWLHGFSDSQALIGQMARSFIAPDDYARIFTPLNVEDLGKSSRIITITLKRRDDTFFPAEVRWHTLVNTNNQLEGFVVVVRDISERRLIEADLSAAYHDLLLLNVEVQRSRDLLRTLFDGLADGFVLLDIQEVVLTANQAFASLIDKVIQQCVGMHWRDICGHSALATTNVLEALQDGNVRQERIRLERAGEPLRILDVQALPLIDNNGRVEQIILRLVDISDRLQLEARVLENERFVASGKLAAMVAHEINTPLQSVQTLLYLVQKAKTEDAHEFMALVHQEIEHIAEIVRQILDLYRPSAMNMAAVDLNKLIRRVIVFIDHTLISERISIIYDLEEKAPFILGQSHQITQVILNVLLNAAQSMLGGGRISITSKSLIYNDILKKKDVIKGTLMPGTPVIALEIGDEGIGIAKEQIPKIFEPFYSTKTEGIGLGLAICAQIVREHGGAIHVISKPMFGTIVTIFLPQQKTASSYLASDKG